MTITTTTATTTATTTPTRSAPTASTAPSAPTAGDPTSRAAELPTDRLEHELIKLAQHLRWRTADLLVLIGEFDDRNAWARFGALSCAAWLADVCDVDIATARSQVRVARAMREHPMLGRAVVDGEISYAKARVLVPYLRDHNVVDLVHLAGRHTAGDLGAAIAAWSRRFEGDEDRDRRHRRERRLSWRTDGDGMVCFTARLPPAEAGKLIAALDHAVMTAPPDRGSDTSPHAGSDPPSRPGSDAPTDAGGDVRAGTGSDAPTDADSDPDPCVDHAPAGASLAQQRADALVRVATTGSGSSSAVIPELVLHVRGDLNTLADGTPIPDHAVTALLPDAFISLLIHDMRRRPIDASPRRRSPTRRQRRVVDERYPTCAHPGCNARVFLQYDHIEPYARGGSTTIANLRRLCGPHNRARDRGRQRAGR